MKSQSDEQQASFVTVKLLENSGRWDLKIWRTRSEGKWVVFCTFQGGLPIGKGYLKSCFEIVWNGTRRTRWGIWVSMILSEMIMDRTRLFRALLQGSQDQGTSNLEGRHEKLSRYGVGWRTSTDWWRTKKEEFSRTTRNKHLDAKWKFQERRFKLKDWPEPKVIAKSCKRWDSS